MSSPRLHHLTRVAGAPDTPEDASCPGLATIRDNLALGNQRLDASAPDALDIAAESVSLLADALRGQASRLCGQHPPDYRRGQMIGRHAITIPDLAWLAGEAPGAVRAALIPLAAAAGYALTPIEGGSARPLTVQAAEATQAVARLGLAVAEVEADGERTEEERRRLIEELGRVKREVADIEAVATDPQLWRSEVATRVAIHQARKTEGDRG